MSYFATKIEQYITSRRTWLYCLVSCSTILLTFVGLTILSSASLSFYKSESFFYKQLSWFLVSIPFFLLGFFLDLGFICKIANQLLGLSIILLCCVLIPGIGRSVNGSSRWLSLGGVNLQVSEFVKFTIVIWLANYIERNKNKIKTFWEGFFVPLIVVALTSLIILFEPDYGTAILLGGVAFSLLFLFGSRVLYALSALFLAFIGISVLIFFNPIRMRRIIAFMDIDANKLEGAYQLWQGILGFVSGGLFGQELGNGRQQLIYLPEAHTDFILSILGEELGSIVVIGILLIYLMIFVTCLVTSLKLNNIYLSVISSGIVLIIIYQVIINVGVVIGLLPTKGMVLPFISYGGSNLVIMFFMIGILLNCFATDSVKIVTGD